MNYRRGPNYEPAMTVGCPSPYEQLVLNAFTKLDILHKPANEVSIGEMVRVMDETSIVATLCWFVALEVLCLDEESHKIDVPNVTTWRRKGDVSNLRKKRRNR
jgi:hypothetical protein